MTALVKIRSERDQMSAVERRIADFILENAQLLRDYSSQQLANALGISQSSVVKFTQKLGFKGYPDLKYAVGEAMARADNGDAAVVVAQHDGDATESGSGLWRRKSEAEEATRLINPSETLDAATHAIAAAGKVFVVGLGEDDIPARAFTFKLSMLGMLVLHSFDMARMTASVSGAESGDVLVVFSEHGNHPALCKIARQFRDRRGRVVTVTRHTSNPVRALADIALLVSAHDEREYIQSLVYQSALQHLLDGIFIHLCENDEKRHAALMANLERIQLLHEP
ncbi:MULTISPECIES: MurR/RpiR family transcriptional regulator [Dyella]|uniref:MurR/RpiR family transcriptional regulator n=2 Tax=Dyella TaxID=231454 RepID=A0A4R0YI19_9GAMM|nr:MULTISPECIES: MurR/RpiR family transcriptional regulator [Dyella]TBR36829.1 MurR/RpiR family transcriptional regulator [Dyella terrae]TCI08080.1 MurR/RpiR family transcriptional regulator [Dyella soli]